MTLSPFERIAIALERIADALDAKHEQKLRIVKDETPFPWNEVSTRLRNAEANSRDYDTPPMTCEKLLCIGRRRFANSNKPVWRFAGSKCVEEIDAIMERLGFGEMWKSS